VRRARRSKLPASAVYSKRHLNPAPREFTDPPHLHRAFKVPLFQLRVSTTDKKDVTLVSTPLDPMVIPTPGEHRYVEVVKPFELHSWCCRNILRVISCCDAGICAKFTVEDDLNTDGGSVAC
jgi:hypothetical protein